MGRGTIASGGTDGLYQVTLDYGDATRTARVAALTAELEALEVTVTALQAAFDVAQAAEDAQKIVVDGAIDSYVTASNAVAPAYDAILAAASALQIAKDALANIIAAPVGTLPDVAAMQDDLAAAETAQADALAAALVAGTATSAGADAVLAALTLLDATNTDFDAAQGTLASTLGSTDAATQALVLALQDGGSTTAAQNAYDAATDAADAADAELLQASVALLDVVNTLDASQLDLRDLQTTDQAALVGTALAAASAYAADGQALLAVYMTGGDASPATKGALQANLNAAHGVYSGQTTLVEVQQATVVDLRSAQDPLEDARTTAAEDLQAAVSDVQMSTIVLASERAGYVAAATAASEVFDAAAATYAAALGDYEAAHDALVQAQVDYLTAHDAATGAFDNTRIALAVLESEFVNLDIAAADYASTAAPLLTFFLTPEAVDAGKADAEAAVAAAQAVLTQANTDYQALQDAVKTQLKAYTDAASELAKLKGETAKVRIPLELMKSRKTQLTKDKATWTALVLTETVPAWCADLTEDATGLVATVEVPGENKLVLIAPAAPSPGPTDGLLTAREVQTGPQVFFNAAILPGWQKYKPTYRVGTVTGLNTDLDTATVMLDAAYSSAQNLPINQAATLADVPVIYMTCNAAAFELGDRCVVKFTGQDAGQPKVVGFVDHPKACENVFYEFFTPDMQDAWAWDNIGSVTAYDSRLVENGDMVYSQSITEPGVRNPVPGIKTPLCRTWAAFNGQRLPEYIHWTYQPGTDKIVGWTASTLVGHGTEHPWMFDPARWSTSLRPAEDVGLDLAPTFHYPGADPIRKVPSDFDAVADQGAMSPATIQSRIYYGRACVQRVISAEFGTRDFFVMTDSHNNFYIYPVKNDGTDTPVIYGGTPMFGITYANNFVKIAAPLPAWAAAAGIGTQFASYGVASVSPNYTEGVPNRVDLSDPDPDEPPLYNHYRYKWVFNSLGTKAAAVVATQPVADPSGAKRMTGYTMGVVIVASQDDPPSSGSEVRSINYPGVVEFDVAITLTGAALADFTATIAVAREFNSVSTGNYYLAADYAFGDTRLVSMGVAKDDLVVATLKIGFDPPIIRSHVLLGVIGQTPAITLRTLDNYYTTAPSSPSVSYGDTLVYKNGARLGKAKLAFESWLNYPPVSGEKRYEGGGIKSLDLRSMSVIMELYRDIFPQESIGTTTGDMFHYGAAVISYGAIKFIDDGFLASDFFNVPLSAVDHPMLANVTGSTPQYFGDYAAESKRLGMASGDQYSPGARGAINSHPSGHIAFLRCPTWWYYAPNVPGIKASWVDIIEAVKKDSGGNVVEIKTTDHLTCFDLGRGDNPHDVRQYSYYDSGPRGKFGSFCTMGVWSTSAVKYSLPSNWALP